MDNRPFALSMFLATADDTARLGVWLAARIGPGDALMLDGPIGSGKTHLARALIRARLGRDEDVPSPTFTLVQTYAADDAEIWHADLYRLTHPAEVLELGLDDAFDHAICLVEWPDRLGKSAPESALYLQFSPDGEGRRVDLTGGPRWADRLARLADDLRG